LAGAARTGLDPDDLWTYAQPTDFGLAVIVSHPAAEQVQAALRAAGHHIAEAVRKLDITVVIDIGRLRPASPALVFAAAAHRTVLVTSGQVDSAVALTHRSSLLDACRDVTVVLTDESGCAAAELAHASTRSVWGVIPHAQRGRRLRRRTAAVRALLDDIARTAVGAV
jgi:hypothetical protein